MVFPGRPLALRTSQFLPRLGSLGGRSSDHKLHQRRGLRGNAQTLRGGQPPIASASGPWWASGLLFPTAAAALIGGGLSYALSQAQQKSKQHEQLLQSSPSSTTARGEMTSKGWAATIAQQPGALKVLDAETLLAQEHPFLEDDHMFSAFVSRGIINDLEGYYLPSKQTFSAIVSLGREVAGFPRVVHGGLTAAIFDEAFGGLLFSLKKDGNVATMWGPAYTVALEVAYKQKIPAGAMVLCSAQLESIEGRKMWFKATMSDGPEGKVYATARALFVSPKPHRMAWDVIKYLGRRVKEVLPIGGDDGGSGGRKQLDTSA